MGEAMRGPGDMAMAGWTGGPMLVMGLVLALLIVGAIALALLLRRAVAGDAAQRVRELAVRRVAARRENAPAGLPGTSEPGEIDAFLIIPDISGYTQFMQLTHFSLAHAQYAVSALLESIIEAAEDCLAMAKVEGDAVFLYGPRDGGGGLTGARIAETIVRILAAFYRTRAQLAARNTCPCEACRHVERLELKTVAHCGRLLRYDLRGQQELSGLAVIVAHRLLKATLDLPRYVLVSEAAHADLPLALDPSPDRHVEHYQGVGEVAARVYRFEPGDLPADERERAEPGLAAKAAEAARKVRENLRALRA